MHYTYLSAIYIYITHCTHTHVYIYIHTVSAWIDFWYRGADARIKKNTLLMDGTTTNKKTLLYAIS